MPNFRFKLQPLQTFREHQRDLCRQVLAKFLADDAALVAQRQELEQTRIALLAEMAEMQQQSRWDVKKVTARRYHAGQLQVQMQMVDIQREQVARQLELCRETLAKADQGVKVLERLSEKQFAEFKKVQEARESRELEDVWQAGVTTRANAPTTP